MEGYPKLANLMGDSRTNGHYLIFQRFEGISAQNLLYLQAEIIQLYQEWKDIAESDAELDDNNAQLFHQDWYELSHSEHDFQWKKWLEIRSRLTEYCTHLTHLFRTLILC